MVPIPDDESGDADDDRGRHGRWTEFQRHWRGSPGGSPAALVSHYWYAEWDLRGQPPYRQLIAPSPHVHLCFIAGAEPVLRGVPRRFGFRELSDRGQVFGVAFRPGAFRPWLGRPVSSITDRSLPAAAVFDDIQRLGEIPAPDDFARVVDGFLGEHLPLTDPTSTEAVAVVEQIAAQREWSRVDLVAEATGLTVRGLQRLFAEHVGIGPKWVIRHYRLREVQQRLAAGTAVHWADVAAELGYADQAHFTRDFTAMLGESPGRYASRYPAGGLAHPAAGS